MHTWRTETHITLITAKKNPPPHKVPTIHSSNKTHAFPTTISHTPLVTFVKNLEKMKPNLTRKAHSQTSCHCGNTEWQSNRIVALAAIDNSQRLHETTLVLLFSTSQAMKNTHFASQHTRRNAHMAKRNTYHSYHCIQQFSSTQNT